MRELYTAQFVGEEYIIVIVDGEPPLFCVVTPAKLLHTDDATKICINIDDKGESSMSIILPKGVRDSAHLSDWLRAGIVGATFTSRNLGILEGS